MDEITSGQLGGEMEELAFIGFTRVGAGTWQPTQLYEAKRQERIKLSHANWGRNENRRPRLLDGNLWHRHGITAAYKCKPS